MISQDVEQQIPIILDVWTKAADPERIILFGSAVRDRMTDGSDLDFLVVWKGEGFPNNRRRAGFLLRALIHKVSVPVDVIVLTPEQFEIAVSDPRTFTSMIVREGRVLYERLGRSHGVVEARDDRPWRGATGIRR